MIVIAHDIRSLHNIGSIFRNSAAFGIEKLYLTGFTETPPRKEIAKVALGAQDIVSWEKAEIKNLISKLKDEGYEVWGLENGEGAISVEQLKLRLALFDSSSDGGTGGGIKKLALVLGNEVAGIDQDTLNQLDGIVEIPMQKKKSLNVSVASGIAMHVLS